jgi:hypothetical protein
LQLISGIFGDITNFARVLLASARDWIGHFGGRGSNTVVRPSTIAVLRSNGQVLELMAAQFEELASRTVDVDELSRLKVIARKCRILAGEMSEAVYSPASLPPSAEQRAKASGDS